MGITIDLAKERGEKMLERELNSHEHRLLNMTPERAAQHLKRLRDEQDYLVDKKLDVLEQKERAMNRFDSILGNIDTRQREVATDIQILEGAYIGLLPEDDYDEHDKALYYSGCKY